MNVDDEDVVLFMDLASHLGGFGYHVAPPPEQSRWYQAGHAHLPRFEFTRWRRFVWLQAEAPLRLLQAGDKTDPLAWINSLRESSLVTKHHLQHLETGEHAVVAAAFLPLRYEPKRYDEWLRRWIRETRHLAIRAT